MTTSVSETMLEKATTFLATAPKEVIETFILVSVNEFATRTQLETGDRPSDNEALDGLFESLEDALYDR